MNDIRVNYDSLCYATFINVKQKTKGANRIVLRNFDYSNAEHKFVIALIMACHNVLDCRDIVVDDHFFARLAMRSKYGKAIKLSAPKKTEQVYVDVEDMLEFMRGTACELCGPNFTFGSIYNFYYNAEVGYDT